MALPFRTVLNDRFLVGRVLGRPGGFGITYLAWDMVLDTTAAIKEFLPLSSVSRGPGTISVRANSEQDEAFFSQGLNIFLREAKTLAQFSHPNIVRIRDYFTANNTAYLVMDYHQGRPIDRYLKECGGRLTAEQALAVMLPILSGLEAIHEKGFLHRDIKPQNIYLTDKDVPILLDFGAARFSMADAGKTLTVMLSAGFAPFEQYHKKGRQGPWSDIYACGATLYYLVTGKMPADAIERQHDDKLEPPVKYHPQLSPAFSQAIMAAMATSPPARPQNIGGFRSRLVAAAQPALPATEIIAPTTRRQVLAQQMPCQPLKTAARPVRHPVKNNGPGRGSLLLSAALASVLVFGWYAGRRNSGQEGMNREPDRIPAAAPVSGGDRSIDTRPIAIAEPATVPSAEIQAAPENRGDFLQPQPAAAIAAPEPEGEQPAGHRPSSLHDIAVCDGKPRHADCPLEPPNGANIGWCLPTGNRQLICIPKPPSGGRHSGPDFRHPPRPEFRP